MGNQLFEMAAFSLVFAVGGGDQKPEHERCERGDQPGALPYDILGVAAQMLIGQLAAYEDAEERASENAGEGCQRHQ